MNEMTEGLSIGETPTTISVNESVDSGYLTFTSGVYTPVLTGCRSRLSCVPAKRHRSRLDPLQSERAQRHRSKLNHLLNASESDYLEIQDSCQDVQDGSSMVHEQDSGLDGSSPGLARSQSSAELSSGLRCLDFRDSVTGRTRRRSFWRSTAAPITPASSKFQLLSPPPSPAVPSSSFAASEPIEEDVEMKLVIVPQSTPQISSPGRKTQPPPRILVSPSVRDSPPAERCAQRCALDQKRHGELSITDLAGCCAEIKPKRLDFSHRALSVALHRTRATPDYTGRETVDLLGLLGEKSNHWRIVSKILSFLGPQDLCSISMVSKAWRRICANDSRANTRRLSHVILRQNAKENLKLIRKAKIEADLQASPRSRYARKGYLLEVQNLLQVQPHHRPPTSPPVSPSKVKFHSFVKASRTLAPWEHLLPCPMCSFPCHVDGEKNVGTCSRQGCSMEFCTSCSSRPHTGPCKTPLLATPTKRNKRLVVGSRQSKRNLRRL